jgi:hypothetical protein
MRAASCRWLEFAAAGGLCFGETFAVANNPGAQLWLAFTSHSSR